MRTTNRSFVRPIVAAVLVVTTGLFASLAGCSGGLTTQEAYETCKELQKSVGDESTFDECVACFENCSDCVPAGTSPETYKCPGEDEGTAASTGSSSSGG